MFAKSRSTNHFGRHQAFMVTTQPWAVVSRFPLLRWIFITVEQPRLWVTERRLFPQRSQMDQSRFPFLDLGLVKIQAQRSPQAKLLPESIPFCCPTQQIHQISPARSHLATTWPRCLLHPRDECAVVIIKCNMVLSPTPESLTAQIHLAAPQPTASLQCVMRSLRVPH